ncbi:MAG: transglutaminase-like enzyme predicted cysteine protease [Planctomycetota bacterium]|nr:transglutaminase-like enzyme predicted cysteine protease [Planctomycetota bacterium]
MNFERLYRASMYVTLFLATLLLNVDASRDNRYAMLFPLGAAVGGFLAFVTVDRDPRRGLPRDLANFLSFVSFAISGIVIYNQPNLMLLGIGHALVYLQVIKYFLPKTVEDDWYLFLIGLVEAVIGVFISQSDEVGLLLISWAIASLWTLGLFFLRRESLRDDPPREVTILPASNRLDPYPGLINLGFVFATLRVAATTLALGVMIFLLMPRWSAKAGMKPGQSPAGKHLTGFSDSVTLGQMGEILENDSVVMSVELTDEASRVVNPPPDLLIRGVTLTDYGSQGGRWQWSRQRVEVMPIARLNDSAVTGRKELRQRIKLEATDNEVLFSVRPILRAQSSTASELAMNRLDGTLFRRDIREYDDTTSPRSGKYDYRVVSDAGGSLVQEFEAPVDSNGVRVYTHLYRGLEAPLQAIVDPIVAALPTEEQGSNLAKARALEHFLREGEFTYSLRMTVVDPNLDPVLDFLTNRKSGHCEYFASALTLMCRAAGIPARMVNGFKGGDDAMGHVVTIREKHAHSWVEALVGSENGAPVWETLDPTPSRQREETVAKVGGGSVRFRYLGDSIRNFWAFKVVGYDRDRQEQWIYGPIRELATAAMLGFRLMGQMFRDATKWLYFESPGQFFSVRGFLVSFFGMLLLVGLVRIGHWLVNRLLGRTRDRNAEAEARDPGLAFYHRLVRILSSLGLERPAGETPREFARRAATLLEDRDRGGLGLAGVPPMVVEAFYSKRFGQRELSPALIRELEDRLEALETDLAAPRAG